MKGFYSVIQKYLKNHKNQKRHIAVVLALSVLVSFAVPLSLIMPAISMTTDAPALTAVPLAYYAENSYMITNEYGDIANENCSPKELSEKTLLIGDGVDWAENLNTAGEVIEAAKQIYFLGIASDFSIFLENDFNPKDSDTEGRAAVGGNIIFEREWNYQIGNGDFATGTALNQTDNFSGRTNYAHVITQGGIKNINVISQGKDKDNNYLYKNDLYKRFVVSSSADLTDTSNFSHSNGNAYSQSCNHASGLVNNLNELACFYKADLIDFTETFNWLRNQSKRLARNSSSGTASVNGTVLTLDGLNKTDSTLYFSLSSWNSDINEINFVNVPDNANFVINCGGETVSTISKNTVKTTINGTVISNVNLIQTNNNVKSEQILYNLYEASSVFIDTNFNGTILAPNADVTSNVGCNGHLSGALIAKSFTGGLEFGYRPYRGTVDILGSSAGYSVPVDKFRTDGTTHLAGASFILQEALSGETYKTVDSWKSSDKTDFITIPSKVDFSGDTSYNVNDTVSQDYVIREQSPPAGYIGTDDYYKISLKEQIININTDSNSKTYPKQVKTTVQITKCIQNGNSTTETPVISWVIDITDSEDSSVRDIIITESGGTPAEIGKFRLSIDSATQKITNVSSIDSNGESTAIEIDNLNKACTFALGDKSFYFDPDSLMVMPIAAESISFTNNYGLVFRKVDGSGAPLKGADIKFQEKQSDYVNVDWNWSANISSLTIDPDSLTQGTIYRFHEESPPSGYETASDIYFMKTGDTTVKYADSEEALSVSGNILDLTNDDSRTIIMTDIQIAGAALKLKKVDSGDNTKLLSGSEFKLYAADGDVPVYPLNGTFKIETGELDLFNTLRNAAADSFAADYVQNGYLKAGSYYLKEITPPAGYTAPNEPFYFTVNKSGSAQSGYEIIAGKPQYADFTVENTSLGKEIWANGKATGVTKIEIEVETPASGSLVLYENSALNAKTADIIDGVATFTFDNPIDVTGRFKIQNTDYDTGLQVKAVRVYGGNGSSETIDYGNGITVTSTVISIDSKGLNRAVTDDMITNDSVVISLTFNTANNQFGWGNAGFTGIVNGSEYKQTVSSYLPSGCNSSEYQGAYNISFNAEKVTISLKPSDICKILGANSFSEITAFGVKSWNSTTISDVLFTNVQPNISDTGNSNSETEEIGSISAEGMTITIANDKTGSKVSVTAEKQWENDTGFESLRPASVSIQLKRSASSDLSAPESVGEPVILNAGNSWKYEWSKLDSLQEDNITPYYYFVQEISNTAGYTVSYENNSGLSSGGTVTIINSLSTRDYNVEKVWNTNNVPDVNIPDSITVKLQSSADNGATWTDVSGKTLVLNEAVNWKGKFEDLPDVSNLQFRVTEVDVPDGWTSASSTSPDGTLTVTNTIKTGSLKLRKKWQDNKDGSQSGVWVNLYRSLTPPGDSTSSVSSQSTVNQISQTFAALRMSSVRVLANEKYYSIKDVGTITDAYSISVDYSNIKMIELYCDYSSSDFGANITVNQNWDYKLSNISNGNNSYIYTYSFETPININSVNVQGMWNGTMNITEIRFYYDSGNTFSLSLDKNVIRNNDTDTATLICDGEGVKYTMDKDNVALLNGNILSPIGIGTVRITASADGGGTQYVDLNVVGDLSVKSPDDNHVIGFNETLQLTALNNIGDVTWAVKDSSDIVTIDSATGMITSNTQTGEATITAMDSYDNMVAEFTVTVEAVGLIPALPNNKELVGRYEIRKDDDWLKEVNGLPYTDENGAKCYYYIVECDSDGNETAAITNNGVQYIPLSYADNGSALDEQPPEISVTNMITKKLQGTMPSTGGEGKIKYNVTGLAIMLSSSAVYYLIRRRRKKAS